MICLLITMTILISGIESAEQRRHPETILSKEELDDRTKAWLLMVESGKVDEEQLRKITPKSVFIAPLLSSRSGKCKEGYTHDHLGQCVKIIKVDPNLQLELLLKRLSAMYAENKPEEEEQRLPVISNGPLHFSIPISNSDTTPKEGIENDVPEMIPVPLPMLSVNTTTNSTTAANGTSTDTKMEELESSGFGALGNESDVMEGSGFESSGYGSGSGSGSGSGESPIEDNTSSIDLISDELDYTDYTEATTTEIPTTEIPNNNHSYQSLNQVSDSSNGSGIIDGLYNETDDSGGEFNDTLRVNEEEVTENTSPENFVSDTESIEDAVHTSSVLKEMFDQDKVLEKVKVVEKPKQQIIRFPEEETRTHTDASATKDFVRFPDQEVTRVNFQNPTSNWNTELRAPSTISRQEFWWLPENWKVDQQQHKPTLIKFWSRLPLVHDTRFTNQGTEVYKKTQFYPSQPHSDFFRPSPRVSDEYTVGLSPPLPYSRRGRFYRSEEDSIKSDENISLSL